MTASTEPPRRLEAEVLIKIGVETYEIGTIEVTPDSKADLVAGLRRLADEIETGDWVED